MLATSGASPRATSTARGSSRSHAPLDTTLPSQGTPHAALDRRLGRHSPLCLSGSAACRPSMQAVRRAATAEIR